MLLSVCLCTRVVSAVFLLENNEVIISLICFTKADVCVCVCVSDQSTCPAGPHYCVLVLHSGSLCTLQPSTVLRVALLSVWQLLLLSGHFVFSDVCHSLL